MLWIALEVDRWVVTGLLVAAVVGTLVAVGYLYPPAQGAVRAGDSVDTLFQALLTGTVTGVTLVLTINQLVLSQELGAVGDQRERMAGSMDFRDDVADAVEAPVSPARPAEFLRALVEVSGHRAGDLREAVPRDADADLVADVEDLAESVTGNAEDVSRRLDGAEFGTYDVVSAALDFNYSRKIFAARRIHERYGDALDEDGTAALERLIEALELFAPAREHFKTLYFQWELVDLSRRILLTAVPALVVSAEMIVFLDVAAFEEVVLGADALVAVVAVATTVAVVPFLLLLAYVVRIATVTKRTLAIGPFVLREAEDLVGVEWDGEKRRS